MRRPPKRDVKVGETLYMYSALRTRGCSLITKEHTLKAIQKVNLRINPIKNYFFEYTLTVDEKRLLGSDIDHFVKLDGFKSVIEFLQWWCADGIAINLDLNLYHWTDLRF